MSTITIPKILANFETSLAATMSASATTLTLNASVDGDGTTLSGLYSLTFDEGTSSEEHMLVTMAGAAGTVSKRGLSRVDAFTEVTANKMVHNRGASAKVTNVSAINIQRLLNGDETFNSVNWLGVSSITGLATAGAGEVTKAASVAYVNAVALAGASDATTTTKGIVEEATQAEVAAGTAAGSTSARLFANPSTLAPHVQAGTWLYAAEDGSGSDDTYTAALVPTLTAYTTGMHFLIKLTVANTAACTLNLNGLGAKNIKKYVAGAQADPETGDIIANQFCMFYYDGTSMVLLNPSAAMPTTANLQSITTNLPTLVGGVSTVADSLHTHSLMTLDDQYAATGFYHLPIYLETTKLVLGGNSVAGVSVNNHAGSIYVDSGTNAANWAAFRSTGTNTLGAGAGGLGLVANSTSPLTLASKFTLTLKFRLITLPSGTNTFFLGLADDADTLDNTGASPTTSNHMGIQCISGATWRVTNGDGTTQKTTTITTPATGFHILKIQKTATTTVFTLDGTILATHSVNIPLAGDITLYSGTVCAAATNTVYEFFRTVDLYLSTT